MIPQKDLALMAKRFEKTVKNNFFKLAQKKKLPTNAPSILRTPDDSSD
jgi:hypothetical protein